MKNESPLIILLDSSFLLTALRQRLDFEDQLRKLVKGKVQLVIPDRVMFELGRLARKKSSVTSGLARIAVELVEKRTYSILETSDGPSDVDSSLIATALAQRQSVVVATVDAQMRRALELQNVQTISPRGRTSLILSERSIPVRLK
jgi:rRNA-processing protein FCF1